MKSSLATILFVLTFGASLVSGCDSDVESSTTGLAASSGAKEASTVLRQEFSNRFADCGEFWSLTKPDYLNDQNGYFQYKDLEFQVLEQELSPADRANGVTFSGAISWGEKAIVRTLVANIEVTSTEALVDERDIRRFWDGEWVAVYSDGGHLDASGSIRHPIKKINGEWDLSEAWPPYTEETLAQRRFVSDLINDDANSGSQESNCQELPDAGDRWPATAELMNALVERCTSRGESHSACTCESEALRSALSEELFAYFGMEVGVSGREPISALSKLNAEELVEFGKATEGLSLCAEAKAKQP